MPQASAVILSEFYLTLAHSNIVFTDTVIIQYTLLESNTETFSPVLVLFIYLFIYFLFYYLFQARRHQFCKMNISF